MKNKIAKHTKKIINKKVQKKESEDSSSNYSDFSEDLDCNSETNVSQNHLFQIVKINASLKNYKK